MSWLQNIFRALTDIGLASCLDIAIVTLVIYAFLVALKRTRRSGLIFVGIVILGLIYLGARQLNLVLTVALLQGFFAVILVALVVIFQEDLRYFFERVGLWWRERSLPRYKRHRPRLPRREVEVLARSLGDMGRARIGALVVVRGHDMIARHLEGGEDVEARLSEPLLKSIFDPHSLGHDGAVIIEGNRIEMLGVHLPLSKNLDKLPRSGTRHAAALGLSERTDALCLVVSEERGTISIVRRGEIRVVADAGELAEALEAFYHEINPQTELRLWRELYRRNSREKLAAFVLAVTLWTVVVHRSEVVQRSYKIPVLYGMLGTNLVVQTVQPENVRVTFSAPRKEFDFVRPGDIRLRLQLWDTKAGQRQFRITSDDLTYPSDLNIEDIEPRQVTLDIEGRPDDSPKPGSESEAASSLKTPSSGK
jgi:diadenylate cyclase